ncbi:MAG: outer membrane protein assembly factor BamE [Acidobacteriota bacterium]
MPRFSSMGAILLVCFGVASGLSGQTQDTLLDDANKEIALLRSLAADQDRRIAVLESAVRSMQTTVLALARSAPTNGSRIVEGWAAVKIGMSRDQVVSILGEPSSTFVVIDRQTLYYKEGNNPVGAVVIIDDRVSEVAGSRFEFYPPARK